MKLKFKAVGSRRAYKGIDDDGNKEIKVGDGGVVSVSEKKAKQLLSDFPDYFSKADEKAEVCTGNLKPEPAENRAIPRPNTAALEEKIKFYEGELKAANERIVELEGLLDEGESKKKGRK